MKFLTSKITEVERAKSVEADLQQQINSINEEWQESDNELLLKIEEEISRAKTAEGNLIFRQDIQKDGNPARDLTEAINIVDEKLENEIIRIDADITSKYNELSAEVDKNTLDIANEAAERKTSR